MTYDRYVTKESVNVKGRIKGLCMWCVLGSEEDKSDASRCDINHCERAMDSHYQDLYENLDFRGIIRMKIMKRVLRIIRMRILRLLCFLRL